MTPIHYRRQELVRFKLTEQELDVPICACAILYCSLLRYLQKQFQARLPYAPK